MNRVLIFAAAAIPMLADASLKGVSDAAGVCVCAAHGLAGGDGGAADCSGAERGAAGVARAAAVVGAGCGGG